MDLNEIVRLYNEEGLSLSEVGKKFGKSKSTVLKALGNGGYARNKETGKYELNVSDKTNIDNGNNETIRTCKQLKVKNNVSRETIEEMVNRTYAISSKIDKAIRIKSAIEGKKPIDIVREALKSYIEQKYLDM